VYSATVTPLNVTTWLKTITLLCSSPDVGAEVGFKFCADVGAAVGVAAGGLSVGASGIVLMLIVTSLPLPAAL